MEKEFNLQKFIISIIIIGVVLVIGMYITDSIQTVSLATGTSYSAVNETISLPTTSGIYLAGNGLRAGTCGNLISVMNTTANVYINVANFSQTGCLIKNTTMDATTVLRIGTGTTLRANYAGTFSNDTATSNAAGNITSALATGTSWISILVVVGFAVIILSMLTSGLGAAAGKGEMATPYY